MEVIQLRENSETNSAMEIMANNFDVQDEPFIGAFWYDPTKKELFGADKVLHCDVPFFHSCQFNADVRTGRRLHADIWRKEGKRGKAEFKGDYTQVPRGRVFEFSPNKYVVFVGDWIEQYPEAKDEIISEYQLENQSVEFRKDSHWDIGNGWSDDFM